MTDDQAHRAAELGPDRVELIAADGTIYAINAAGLAALEVKEISDLAGASWPDLWPAAFRGIVEDQLAIARSGRPARFYAPGSARLQPRWWDVTLTLTAGRVLALGRDITAAKQIEEELRRLARHDGLTGLLNRTALAVEIEQAVRCSLAQERQGAISILDLDNFKLINDTVGHDAGDAVLAAVADRLRDVIGTAGIAARLGGDEFAILLPHVENLDALRVAMEAVLARLSEPVAFKGRTLNARASIGAALFPKYGRHAPDLLKNADVALFAAKSFGRGGYVAYVPSMGGPIRRRAAAVSAMRNALADNRVDTFYQPMVDLCTGLLAGLETKFNVRLSDGRIMPPRDITPVFDDIELARVLGDHLLRQVTADARTWLHLGLRVDRIAINAAAAEFRAGDYAARFLGRLAEANLPPTMFSLEIAETVFVGRGTDYVASALKTLSEAGVLVALDQFGSGPASLASLKRFPIHAIKIDEALVHSIETEPADRAVVRAMVELASGFGMAFAVEGVDTAGQAKLLQSFGCEVGQGNLFGMAAGSTKAAAWLAPDTLILPNLLATRSAADVDL